MGAEWKLLAKKLVQKSQKVSVNDNTNLAQNLKELAEDIAYHSRGKDTQIDKNVLLDAFNLELSNVLTDDNLFQEIFSLNNKLAEWIYSGSEVIEKWKFTEENYEFKRKNYNQEIEVYKPIIPVPFEVVKQDFSNKETKVAQNTGINNILNFVNSFDSVLFNAQTLTAVLTPANPIDDLVVLGLRAYYQEKLPDSIKRIFEKIKSVVNQIKNFINDVVKEKINENVALLNAFLCGLINGLISLLQMVILLLGFVIDNIPFWEVEKTSSREAIDEREKQFEFIEDVVDIITENASSLFTGLIKTFINLPRDFVNLVRDLTVQVRKKSQYFWAYMIGAIGFELILDAVIAFFTGGTSLAVSFANKISRATAKATQAGIKLAKQVGKKVMTSIDDIYKFLKKEFEDLIEAIKDGEFVKWIKEKVTRLLDESIGKLSLVEIRTIAKQATKNPNAKKVMLGKYVKNSSRSYNIRAGNNHTYFELDDIAWEELFNKVNGNKDEIFKVNKKFIDNELKIKKDIFFSHNPFDKEFLYGYYKMEIDYLTITLKYKIVQVEENLWVTIK
ncbi:MAG: hypothetical protein CMH15_05315 [Mesonia sp.]|uniref:Uncharacterized protein n=1 Tax=Mesonia oceanica TaxID=2687242 RepID=A0AC61Y761_9FLAO|nr:hypothetical protein [Mesonia sp.]MAQ40464.1 hypothetical protein [Mesonia sp.]MBJ98085.1 hypothetical protein [Flavobacteriaceae bacterium]VVV00302.1 hypothetical protein FVB9532_01571 [Mesonia oceanica]|tara:strand:+ start:21964 stop:23640 length:1677 start_codon:yes stop_codon:yes gene_type:complete